MTRNPDTGKWYATLESTFSFCGFYDYNDALGVGSSHSDPETCRLYKTPLLVMVFTFVAKLLKSTCTWITIYLLIEIVVLVFICTILKVEPEVADVPVMPLLSSPSPTILLRRRSLRWSRRHSPRWPREARSLLFRSRRSRVIHEFAFCTMKCVCWYLHCTSSPQPIMIFRIVFHKYKLETFPFYADQESLLHSIIPLLIHHSR